MFNFAQNQPKEFIGLQYLRGIAALLVVYFHSLLQLKGLSDVSDHFPLFGESGVDIFFVLSGFVMWFTTYQKHQSPGCFLQKRLIRIVPLYWAVTFLAAGVALLLPHMLKSTSFDFYHFLSSLFFIPWPNPAYLIGSKPTITPVIVPGWTLNYEIFFYLIFSVSLVFHQNLRLSLTATALFVLVGLRALSDTPGTFLKFYGDPIILEFLYGVMIAIIVTTRATLKPIPALFIGGLSLAAIIILDIMDPPIDRAFSIGPMAALLILSVASLELSSKVPHISFLSKIGDASYSIYLTHIFTLVLARLVYKLLALSGGLANAYIFILFCITSSTTIGYLAYRYYERPILRRLKQGPAIKDTSLIGQA